VPKQNFQYFNTKNIYILKPSIFASHKINRSNCKMVIYNNLLPYGELLFLSFSSLQETVFLYRKLIFGTIILCIGCLGYQRISTSTTIFRLEGHIIPRCLIKCKYKPLYIYEKIFTSISIM
jgi:hypothetical protein